MSKVLITGASGSVGRYLIPLLSRRRALRPTARNPAYVERPADAGDIRDAAFVRRVLMSCSEVVHLAGCSDPRATLSEAISGNVEMTRGLLSAAADSGVRRLVVASSAHVTGLYDDMELEGRIEASWPVLPCCPYGESKVMVERLCADFHEQTGVSIIILRLGWALDRPHCQRAFRQWLSPNDLFQLVDLSLASDVGFGIYYGVSDNPKRPWSIENAEKELGYHPLDSSEAFEEPSGPHPEDLKACQRAD
jgi:nucleoside-diphosphate-sugar epimerase